MEDFVLLFFLSGCALSDLKTGKIPNILVLLGVASFAISVFIRGPSFGYGGWETGAVFILFFARILFTAGVLFPLFLFRMMGAGDIKVMAVTAGYLGMERGFQIIFYGLAAAAAWSLIYMLRKRILLNRIRYFLNYMKNIFRTECILPYYCACAQDGAGLCLVPFLWCGYCLWLVVNGGMV